MCGTNQHTRMRTTKRPTPTNAHPCSGCQHVMPERLHAESIVITPHVHAYAGLLQPTKWCSNPHALQTKVYTPRGTLVGSNTRRLLILFLPHSFASPQTLLIPVKLECQIVSNSWCCFYFRSCFRVFAFRPFISFISSSLVFPRNSRPTPLLLTRLSC